MIKRLKEKILDMPVQTAINWVFAISLAFILGAITAHAQPVPPPGMCRIGAPVIGGTNKSILYVNSSGQLAQDNSYFNYDDSAKIFKVDSGLGTYTSQSGELFLTTNGSRSIQITGPDVVLPNIAGLYANFNTLATYNFSTSTKNYGSGLTQNSSGVNNLPLLSASLPLKTDSSKNMTAAAIALGGSEVTGTLGVTNGGTGLATATQGDILYSSAANTYSALAKNTSSTRYLSNTGTSNNPAWAQVALGTGVSGTLPVANGGTNASTFTAGSVVFAGSGGTYTQDNSNFFWDDTNNRLGLGTNSPSYALDVIKNNTQQRLGYSTSSYYTSDVTSTGGVNFNAVGSTPAFGFLDPVTMFGDTLSPLAVYQTASGVPEAPTMDIYGEDPTIVGLPGGQIGPNTNALFPVGYYKLSINGAYSHDFGEGERYLYGIVMAEDCIPKGTKIYTPKGWVNIEYIKEGDEVYSMEPDSKFLFINTVAKVDVHPKSKITHVLNERHRFTANHPVYTGRGYIHVDQLKLGDWMLNHNGKKIWVYSLEKVDEPQVTYNLRMANKAMPNYFGGIQDESGKISDLLIHNKCPYLYSVGTDGAWHFEAIVIQGHDSPFYTKPQRKKLKTLTNRFMLGEWEPEISHFKDFDLIAITKDGERRLQCTFPSETRQGGKYQIICDPLPEGTQELFSETKGYYDYLEQ